MQIEIKSHYWPKTPELREIKILIDGKVIQSEFLSQDKIWKLAAQLDYLSRDLTEIYSGMNK